MANATVMNASPHGLLDTATECREGKSALSVLHVVLSLDAGGLERVVVDLAREGRKRGQKVSILCLEKFGALAEEAQASGALLHCARKPQGFTSEAKERTSNIFATVNADIVHTHQIGALLHSGPLACRAGCRTIVHTQHNSHFLTDGNRTQKLRRHIVALCAARHARKFFCVARDTADVVLRRRVVAREKVVVIPNGIDIERFTPIFSREEARKRMQLPVGSTVFGTIGRLSEVKRIDLLIQAFAQVLRQVGDAYLIIVGDGPVIGDLQQQAFSMGLMQRIHFAGFQSCPERYLEAMDGFILTSRVEGMPLAVLEAASMRVPVIASTVGGLDEMSDHGRTMLLYDSGNVAELVAAMLRLVREPTLAQQLSNAGRDRVERCYSTLRMASEYERHYRELIHAAVNY